MRNEPGRGAFLGLGAALPVRGMQRLYLTHDDAQHRERRSHRRPSRSAVVDQPPVLPRGEIPGAFFVAQRRAERRAESPSPANPSASSAAVAGSGTRAGT